MFQVTCSALASVFQYLAQQEIAGSAQGCILKFSLAIGICSYNLLGYSCVVYAIEDIGKQ